MSTTEAATRPRSPSGRGAIPTPAVFAVTAAGGLLVSLDVSVANALMPAIGRDFAGEGRAALAWVVTGYAIVFAAALVPAGRIADRAGRRRTYVGGLAVFALGSLVCGVAPDLGVLLTGRVIQGLGAAAASPASLGLLLAACDARQRATYAARWTGAAAAGVCLGPFVGGLLTEAGDWRWAFLVNLPVVGALVVAAPRLLSETPRHPGRHLPDPVGAGMFAVAAAAASLALSETSTWGVMSVRTVGVLLAGVALSFAFVRRSRRVAEPMLDLALLRNRRVLAAAVVAACYAAAFFGFLLTFLLFTVEHWHLSLVQAGATVLVPGLVVVALTTHVGRVVEWLGHRPVLSVGAGMMAVGLLACAATLDGTGFEARWLLIGPVLGIGIGLCYPVLAGAAVHGLAAEDLAAATAINQCARQLGAAIGVATAIGVLGQDPIPDLGHFHAVWLVGSLFCIAAVVAAALIPPGGDDSLRTTPVHALEERSA
jgi:EmrB/QacA subfamily drug resistance transporter